MQKRDATATVYDLGQILETAATWPRPGDNERQIERSASWQSSSIPARTPGRRDSGPVSIDALPNSPGDSFRQRFRPEKVAARYGSGESLGAGARGTLWWIVSVKRGNSFRQDVWEGLFFQRGANPFSPPHKRDPGQVVMYGITFFRPSNRITCNVIIERYPTGWFRPSGCRRNALFLGYFPSDRSEKVSLVELGANIKF